ncbi:MAG: hypothetical protein HQ518_05745 [Rhodopirellula sp.]|nr:hypothetical protein [Rhodopirellula sp.]
MHYRSRQWATLLNYSRVQALVAVIIAAVLTMPGCDKVEGLVEDGKNLVSGDEPNAASASPESTPVAPAATPTIASPQPVVPTGLTPEQIVTRFQQLRPEEISDSSLAQLASSPEAAAAITEIDMHGAGVSGHGLSFLKALPNLETLNASGLPVSPDSLTVIGKSQSLKNINLSNSGANDLVISELSQIPHLQSLNLDGTQVTGGSATGFGSMLELTDLSLANTAADDQVVAGLASLPLRNLNLVRTRITNAALASILEIKTLESLNVSFCGVTGEGFKGFNKSNLKVLAVGETGFGVEGLVAIKGMASLENLNIYAAGLVEHKLANVFRTFPKLRILNAGKNAVTDAGMVVFFKGHKTLEELLLYGNKGITDNGLAALIGVKTLKLLDVSDTSCGAAGGNALKAKLPECTIRTSNGVF